MRQASWGEVFAPRDEPLALAPEVPEEPRGWRRLFWWEELLTFTLLAVIMLTVVASVDRARWVDEMPALYPIALFGLVLGALLARLSWREPFVHLLALPVGAAAALGMILSVVPGPSPVARYETLEARMGDWFHAAATGGISDDGLPVIVLVVPLAWLASYASSWAAFRWRNAWLALVPGGGALLANISLLPGQFSFAFVVFLLAGTLLVTRMHLVDRERRWRDDGTPYPSFLSLSVLHASFWIALVLLVFGWLLPQANEADALESVWRRATAPVTDRVKPLSRLFISVNAKKAGPVHDFEDILPFLGSIDLTSREVLEVVAPGLDQPHYLRAQAYRFYTSDGWQKGDSQHAPLNEDDLSQVNELLARREDIDIEVVSRGRTGGTIFSLGQPLDFDRDVELEYSSVLDNVSGVQAGERLKRGELYEATGSVSVATEDDLRGAGTDYPDWVLSTHLQLSKDFPTSVSGLASELTGSKTTPYDKALAIETYLRAIPYDLDVPDAPHDADAIEYFLFEAKRGYFDYHASAMVVMLRSVGVPARLAVGYVLRPTGDDADLFRHQVTERSAFAWPEVYFPGLGWVEFNPTPNQPPVRRPGAAQEPNAGPGESDAPPADLNLEGLADLFPDDGGSAVGGALPSADAGDQGRWLLIGVTGGLAALAALAAGGVTAAWLRGTSGLEPAARPWAKTVRLASWARLPQAPSQTPREFARRLREEVTGADGVERLADAYVRHRFGGEQPDEQELARLESAWRTVRGRLLRRLFRLG